VEGDPHEAILQTADAIHADLIVMGTHGRGGVNRLLIGSVTEEVLRMACIPVLAVRTGLSSVAIPARHVLCPMNNSPEARRALDLATLIAGCFGASVMVLHVRNPRESAPILDIHSWIPDALGQRCSIDAVTREGNTAQEIVIAASESSCDLVVIGARHHRFLEGKVLGTTTELVMRHSPCPVMAVPLKGNETPRKTFLMPPTVWRTQ
jgi:nucleotide-binding universal stress UspA family protein